MRNFPSLENVIINNYITVAYWPKFLMKCNHIWTEILDTVYRTGYQNHTISEFQESPLVSFIT